MDPESEEQTQEKKNPIKRKDKQKQFRDVGQSNQILTNPTELYEAARKYKKTFKMVSNQHPKIKDIEIIDFSLNARGFEEDQIYVRQPFYQNNIRRGNTFIVNKQQKTVDIGRKGLKKFFDISLSGLHAIKNENLKKINKKFKYSYNSVFGEIQNVLACNQGLEHKDKAKVHIYKLNKANGENAQVSFYHLTNQWVISSKNVSILVKEPNDIKIYQGERYWFAALIAQTWFNIIEKLNEKQLEALKTDLKGKTLIGQYCGNPDFQHLVKYTETTIYFYAVIQKYSQYTCIMPNQAFEFFQKHQIPIVKNHNKSYIGEFTKFSTLGGQLIETFKEVSKASIFEEQEGAVLYFGIQKPKAFCQFVTDRQLQKTVPIPDKWEEKQVWFHVSSLAKLKTLEYRILRKLREKLKAYTRIKKKQQAQQTQEQEFKKFQQKYGSFERQSYDLLKDESLSKPIQYYFCAGLLAFEYAFTNRKSRKAIALLAEHYLDFLSIIFLCMEQKKPVTEQLMRDEQLHEQLRKQTWQNYGVQVLAEYPAMLERIVPKYAKKKKTMKIGEKKEQDEMVEKEQEEMVEKDQEDD